MNSEWDLWLPDICYRQNVLLKANKIHLPELPRWLRISCTVTSVWCISPRWAGILWIELKLSWARQGIRYARIWLSNYPTIFLNFPESSTYLKFCCPAFSDERYKDDAARIFSAWRDSDALGIAAGAHSWPFCICPSCSRDAPHHFI